jgi:tRNA (guanine26-N2/guanine27-N2)-dimethyltransferase
VYEEQREGQVRFLRPPLQKVPTAGMPVFYNPKSELNRDVTIASIQAFLDQHDISNPRVCVPLAGTGVRAIRVAKEVRDVGAVVAGDINPLAVDLAKRNCTLNEVTGLVQVYQSDANLLLTQHHKPSARFHVIDIDPFGSPRNFLWSAVGALRPQALLCITATDMPVLVGIHRETCIERYASEPLRTEYAHEIAVRILLGCVAREATAQSMGLRPLLTLSVDHYIRLFCETRRGDRPAWETASDIGYLLHCDECGHHEIATLFTPPEGTCPECHARKTRRAGPLWADSLADRPFVERVLELVHNRPLGTRRRLSQILQRLLEELDGPPTYRDLHKLADRLAIRLPRFEAIISAIQAQGYSCTRTHFTPHAIRTNAPEQFVSAVLRQLTGGSDRDHVETR